MRNKEEKDEDKKVDGRWWWGLWAFKSINKNRLLMMLNRDDDNLASI